MNIVVISIIMKDLFYYSSIAVEIDFRIKIRGHGKRV